MFLIRPAVGFLSFVLDHSQTRKLINRLTLSHESLNPAPIVPPLSVMLSSGTTTPVNNKHGPSSPIRPELEHGRPPPVPEKEYDASRFSQQQQQQTRRPPALSPADSAIPPSAGDDDDDDDNNNSYSSTPPVPGAGRRREQQQTFYTDSGSPVKQQSPLRNSISYDDYSGPESLMLSFRGSIEFANAVIGRSNMSYTGDKKSSGRVSLDRAPAWQRGGQGEESPQSSLQSTPTRQVKPQAIDPQTPKSASPSGSSRFAFFSSSISALKGATTASPPVAVPDDELMNLDIHAAVQGSTGDTFSPAAYKNLQMTATGLLHKFQTAYQQRTIAYYELKAERTAQSEEKEEAETRMRHLKMQLEGMARRAAEQEAIMQSLMEELTQEKRTRMEEQRQLKVASVSEGSSVSEDLGAEEDQQRRKWRRSTGTAKSDLGCETDDESIEEASVFSRSRSPTIATIMSETSHAELPMAVQQIRQSTSTSTLTTPRNPPRSGQQPQMSAFQKLFKGISGDSPAPSTSSCRNCEGQDASAAWDTVHLLQHENKGLKERVGELEVAVEGAMDVVNGVAIRER